MTDTDDVRAALREATRLPGAVRPRPAAAGLIRERAVRRRQRALAAYAAGLCSFLVVVTAVAAFGGPGKQSTSLPASPSTPSTAASAEPTPSISISPGPRTFATPLTIAPVLEAYPRAQCPPTADTVPAADGSECYRLGTESIEIHEVRDLQTIEDSTVTPDGGVALHLTLNEEDAQKLYALTKKVAQRAPPADRLAWVSASKVYVAPTTDVVPVGNITMRFDDETQLWAFLGALGG